MFVFAGWSLIYVWATVSQWTLSSAEAITPVGDLPNVSIQTADGAQTTLAATNGHVRIAGMFYAHCPGVCPATLATLRQIDAGLSEQQRSQLRFILLSLDPARDSPETLRKFAPGPRWLLGRASETDTRSFASAAHIQYRTLSDGSIDHSAGLVLLDSQGRVIARAADAGDTSEFAAAVRQALQ
jgi:protein SCO1/2